MCRTQRAVCLDNIVDPKRDMDELIVRRAEVFRQKQGIDVQLGRKVERIDRANKKAMGRGPSNENFEISFEKLLITTGARARVLDIPGNDLPGIVVRKLLEDGRILKNYIEAHGVKRAAIIGTGYIGLEMAEAFHARNVAVHMFDILPRLLPWLPETMAEVVRKELEDKGAQLHMAMNVGSIEQAGQHLRLNFNSSGVEVDMILDFRGDRPELGNGWRGGIGSRSG